MSPALSIIVPCYNERANVRPLVARLATALAGVAWEAVFVDDNSPDGTADEARALAAEDPRVRCIRRIGRRGLSSAVVEGALSSSATYLAVIDGDLQHDETRLPDLLAAVQAGADIAVGSRHVPGGDSAGLSGAWRHRISDAGTRLAQHGLPVPLSDPMSGYFLLPRRLFEQLAPRLTAQGFKILLDLVLSSPLPLRVVEIPCRFHPRTAGQSKLDVLVLIQFAALLLDKWGDGVLPLRFISFGLVGLVGVAVHLVVLSAGRALGADFAAAQIGATLVAMLANFQLNNVVTYRDARLRGPALVRGLVVFLIGCGLGAYANIGIAQMLYSGHAGWTPAGLAGAAIGLVWNYTVSATLVWRAR
ncbi:glycosyltransferase family 2 protein [Acidisphaera sp. L21]|uniref:glycosyltransferase n=1 Tax=Acidisphaera sp. L21 TaxID=1641851 RepID=UPI00131BE4C2|nr:glycosyltransferase family 2 protein [Acidisphaera sp. L21]